MEAYERVRAVFRPQRTDDLQYGGEKHIGKTYTFEACWVIDEGPYEGQWAFVPVDYTRDAPALKYFG